MTRRMALLLTRNNFIALVATGQVCREAAWKTESFSITHKIPPPSYRFLANNVVCVARNSYSMFVETYFSAQYKLLRFASRSENHGRLRPVARQPAASDVGVVGAVQLLGKTALSWP